MKSFKAQIYIISRKKDFGTHLEWECAGAAKGISGSFRKPPARRRHTYPNSASGLHSF